MKYITVLGVIAVFIAVFAYYSLFAVPEKDSAEQAGTASGAIEMELSNTGDLVGPLTGVGSLEELKMLSRNLECTIKSDNADGTFFIGDGKMRGDFLTDSPDFDEMILSSMIINETMMYIWSEIEGETYGMKVSQSLLAEGETDTNEPVPLDEDVRYSCKEWLAVDNTVFVPPGEVLFQDMADLINVGMEYGNVYEEGAGMEMP